LVEISTPHPLSGNIDFELQLGHLAGGVRLRDFQMYRHLLHAILPYQAVGSRSGEGIAFKNSQPQIITPDPTAIMMAKVITLFIGCSDKVELINRSKNYKAIRAWEYNRGNSFCSIDEAMLLKAETSLRAIG
jgi:hypothetical protein